LLGFTSYQHIAELITVTQIITNACLNEIEKRGELTDHPDGRVIVPLNADFAVETNFTRRAPSPL
jgi:hypothetical protein